MQAVKEGILLYLIIAIFIVSLSEVTLTFGANAQRRAQLVRPSTPAQLAKGPLKLTSLKKPQKGL